MGKKKLMREDKINERKLMREDKNGEGRQN